jgi:hypothetical protein
MTQGQMLPTEVELIIRNFGWQNPPFEFTVGWAEDFNALLQGSYTKKTGI